MTAPRLRRCLSCFLLLLCVLVSFSDAGEKRPNVLLIISDDLTCCLGSYGHPICRTPHLDRLANEGVRFERAFCQFPVCGPSRASLMSGLYPEQNGVMGNTYKLGSYRAVTPSLADHPSIGGFLKQNGYASLRVSKIYHMGVPGGIEAGSAGGDDPESWDRAFNIMGPETTSPGVLELLSPKVKHYGANFTRIMVPNDREGTQTDVLATSQAVAILENFATQRVPNRNPAAFDPDQPFFLAVGLVRPHVPSVAPQRLFEHYPPEKIELPHVPKGDLEDVPKPAKLMWNETRYGMNDTQKRQAIAAYYASVEFMDEQVGRLLATLDRLDIRDETIVIFTSDHGFQLGEHDLWQKLSLFESSTRVPLIISAPGLRTEAVSESPVELLDLYPTIAELTGLSDRQPKNLAGHSLVPLLSRADATLDRHAIYTVTHQGGRALRTERWCYHVWKGKEEELYDLKNDPQQFRNLVDDPAFAEPLREMRAKLKEKRRSIGVLSR